MEEKDHIAWRRGIDGPFSPKGEGKDDDDAADH